MPDKVPNFIDREQVEEILAHDKKAVDGVPYFVTIDGIGKLHVENGLYSVPIPKKALDEAMDYIFK